MPTLGETAESWRLEVDRWGNPEVLLVTWTLEDGQVSGSLGPLPLVGRLDGNELSFEIVDGRGETYGFTGHLEPSLGASPGDWAQQPTLRGIALYPDTQPVDDSVVEVGPRRRVEHALTGRRLPARESSIGGIVHAHEPTSFSNEFSARRDPQLVIWPGDRVRTRTVDSGGLDHLGDTRALYGNPQTGPFFVATAQPGDVLAVHIHRLTLDRDFADSLDGWTERAMTTRLAAEASDLGQRVRWRLDREAGVAQLENPPPELETYRVPLRPMLGGLGVAPGFGAAAASAGDSGGFGGNMDWNGLVEGVTVYLPVLQPGALLYLGDGHALQGDGETTQWALETSLEVEFQVDVLPARRLATPRARTATHLTTLGQAGSLDDAVRQATAGMVQWLEQDYGWSAEASSLVLGTAAEYRVTTLAGRNAGIALSLPLALLGPPKASETPLNE